MELCACFLLFPCFNFSLVLRGKVEEVESHMRDNLELVGEVAEREVGMDMDIVCTFLVSA